MSAIKLLEQHIADKIAAGEVIERPLSVVKELLENSLDAGATMVDIAIKDGGIGLIRVRDNGSGMDGDDLALAFERHATSKIHDFNDLFALDTFGFRGEALPSIAAVAQVEMSSCTKESSCGHKITLAGGVAPELTEIGATNGTMIEVKNLFYNIPARRKFIKGGSGEAGAIGELVSKYALGHPTVRFKLSNNGQVTIDTAGLHSVAERLVYFHGKGIKDQIITVERTTLSPGHYLEAWLLQEDVTRNNRQQETFFVNGRLIKSLELSHALEESYYTMIAKGRFPMAVVKLTLPGQDLDVNIHPAKLEIKINGFERLRRQMIEVLKDALWATTISKNAVLPKSALLQTSESVAPVAQPKAAPVAMTPQERVYQPKMDFALEEILTTPMAVHEPVAVFRTEPTASVRPASLTQMAQSAPSKVMPVGAPVADQPTTASTDRHEVAQLKDIAHLTLMGQLNNSFIVAQNQEGLFIIDQHTCHERILYERLMAAENQKQVMTENLLLPVTINLTPQEDSLLVQHILVLRELGFLLENFGDRSYLIRGLPLGLNEIDHPEQFFIDLIDDLAHSKQLTPAIIKEKIVTVASCKGAVKARFKLTEVEMLTLLHDLAQVENAHTCPHGRPIVYKLSMADLYSIFKRGAYTYDQ